MKTPSRSTLRLGAVLFSICFLTTAGWAAESASPNDGNTPLHLAVLHGDASAVDKLLSKGVDTKATNDIPLYAGEDIGQSNFAMRGLDSLLVLAFGWLL